MLRENSEVVIIYPSTINHVLLAIASGDFSTRFSTFGEAPRFTKSLS